MTATKEKKPKAKPTPEEWAAKFLKGLSVEPTEAQVKQLANLKGMANAQSSVPGMKRVRSGKVNSPSAKRRYAQLSTRGVHVLCRMGEMLKASDAELGALARKFDAEIARRFEAGDFEEPFLDSCMTGALAKAMTTVTQLEPASV